MIRGIGLDTCRLLRNLCRKQSKGPPLPITFLTLEPWSLSYCMPDSCEAPRHPDAYSRPSRVLTPQRRLGARRGAC